MDLVWFESSGFDKTEFGHHSARSNIPNTNRGPQLLIV